jgi:hypothetical protein
MMWNIMKWWKMPRGNAKTEYVLETQPDAHSLPRVEASSNSTADSSGAVCSPAATDFTPGRDVFSGVLQDTQDSPASAKDLFDRLSLDRLNHEAVATRSAMAYWRKSTRRERPSDKVTYDHFRGAGHSWSNMLNAGEPSQSQPYMERRSPDLSAFLVSDTRDGMWGLYARRVQGELEKRFEQSTSSSLSVPDDATTTSEAQFRGILPEHSYRPAYIDDYFFAPCESTGEEVGADVGSMSQAEMPEMDRAQEPEAEIFASPTPEQADVWADAAERFREEALTAIPGSLVKDKIASWKQPEQAEIRETLHSIASSPECENALNGPRVDVDKQRETVERLPYAQFVDVRIAVADHPDTSMEVLEQLASDANPDVRFAIAENHNAAREVLHKLTFDDNPYVAHRARRTLQRLEGGKKLEVNFSKSATVRERFRQTGSSKS